MKTALTTGMKVTNEHAFTSPIGTHFPAGTTFTVEIGAETGALSLRCRADMCGSTVWIVDGRFLDIRD